MLELTYYFTRRGAKEERNLLLIKMASMRRHSIVSRGRPPLSAHSHQVNSVSRKILDPNDISSDIIKTNSSLSPSLKSSKTVLCTPDVSKERSVYPTSRPQVMSISNADFYIVTFDLSLSFPSKCPCLEMLVLMEHCFLFFLFFLGKTSTRSRRISDSNTSVFPDPKGKELWKKENSERYATLPKM